MLCFARARHLSPTGEPFAMENSALLVGIKVLNVGGCSLYGHGALDSDSDFL